MAPPVQRQGGLVRTACLTVAAFFAVTLQGSARATEIFRFDFSNGTLAPSSVDAAAQAAGLVVHDLTVTGSTSFAAQDWPKTGFVPPMVWCLDWGTAEAFQIEISVPAGFELVVTNAVAKVGHVTTLSRTYLFTLSLDDQSLAYVGAGTSNSGTLAWMERLDGGAPTNPPYVDAPLHLQGGQSHFLRITSEPGPTWAVVDDIYLFGELVHTPEPASVTLLLAAGAGCLAIRRRV